MADHHNPLIKKEEEFDEEDSMVAVATRATAQQEDELQLQAKERAAAQLFFAELCSRLERVTREGNQKSKRLAVLFPRKLVISLKGCSPYPLFRLVLPHIDTARGNYNVKQVGLAKLYVDVLGLDPKRSADAQKLMRYRQPRPPHTLHSTKTRAITYDWPEVLEDALTGRVSREPSKLTLGQVNSLLDELAQATDTTERQVVLNKALVQLSANEQKWLARIIMQDMKIGLWEEQVLGYYHDTAMEVYDSTCDLRYTCAALCDSWRPIDRAATQIRLHGPFAPMLAAQVHHQLTKVEPAMRGNPFAMEMKIDGERMLCHKDGDRIEWYTRSATNYTQKYGPILSPRVVSRVRADKCILDGEVVGWDSVNETFLHFKENRSIAADGGDADGTRTLVYVVFDCVYLEDSHAQALLDQCCAGLADDDPAERRPGPLTALPFRARRDVLEALIQPLPKQLELVRHERVESTDPEQRVGKLMDSFDAALQNMEEGLMVKDLKSAYILGEKARGLQHWVKMKPEYSDQTTNLDVIVLGAYFSEGKRRSGRIASFLIGVAASPMTKPGGGGSTTEDEDMMIGASSSATTKTEPPAFEPKCFYTLGRVGSGVTFPEWDEVERKLPFKKWRGGYKLPGHFKPWKPGPRDIPDFWIDPTQSVVLEVKCAEINETESFSAGVTLRFPRIEAIRWDKPWSQCVTLKELRDIYARPVRKTTGMARGLSSTNTQVTMPSPPMDMVSTPTAANGGLPPRRRAHKPPPPVRIVSTYQTLDPGSVPVERNLLQGAEICVMGDFDLGTLSSSDDEGSTASGSDSSGGAMSVASNSSAEDHQVMSKGDVEKMVLENGGKLTSSPRLGETALIVAPDAKSLRVKMLVKSGKFDVVGLAFLLRCVRKGRLMPPHFDEYLFMTKATREKLNKHVDLFGDAYVEPTNVKMLGRCFRQMKTEPAPGQPPSSSSSSAMLLRQLQQDDDPAVRTAFRDSRLAVFATCCVYLDRYEDLGKTTRTEDTDGDPLPVTRLDPLVYIIRLYGGDVAPNLHAGVTHVVVDRQETERFSLLANRLKTLRRMPVRQVEKRVVCPAWVDACVQAGKVVVPSGELTVQLTG